MAEVNEERLNFVCVDNSEFSMNAFNWYVENHHREGDKAGLVYVPPFPTRPMTFSHTKQTAKGKPFLRVRIYKLK